MRSSFQFEIMKVNLLKDYINRIYKSVPLIYFKIHETNITLYPPLMVKLKIKTSISWPYSIYEIKVPYLIKQAYLMYNQFYNIIDNMPRCHWTILKKNIYLSNQHFMTHTALSQCCQKITVKMILSIRINHAWCEIIFITLLTTCHVARCH